ncbi:hypothetical protein CHS0354_009550 [Potamilus streckersoni]|uniref:Uncharacterized protein n=1 Tax=Potamilus streckersoni TaxID=2493646 RepID=A0AAE0SPU6_9BIVA|nr:hypothetical protein CHS0354_009550 [Potamilus streckersoni]
MENIQQLKNDSLALCQTGKKFIQKMIIVEMIIQDEDLGGSTNKAQWLLVQLERSNIIPCDLPDYNECDLPDDSNS